jgi:tetraacyldisaccharide-1-P 4'-kinase
VARLAPRAAIFSATHTPTAWIRQRDEQALPLDSLHGRDVFCFAGIADFDSFAQTVEALGARTVGLRRFADHHAYSDADIAALAREAAAATPW